MGKTQKPGPTVPFVRRVTIRNYKSIGFCDVELSALTFLVGPNGAGKSNFLDAFRFVADSLRTSLDHALRDRGGIKEVRRRSGGHPTHFSIELHFAIDGLSGKYAFRIGAQAQAGFEVQEEECRLFDPSDPLSEKFFRVEAGTVTSSSPVEPAPASDRLYLVAASGLKDFRPVYDAFSRMGSYTLNPAVMRELQPPDPGDLLARDGHNIASVLQRLSSQAPKAKERIEQYLSKVVPGVYGVDAKPIGPKETLEFRQQVAGSKTPWRFLAANMSDGTLRALGILVALYQTTNGLGPVRFVGIEEPEIALHPAAAGVLRDSLREASLTTQVVVTSHSPDLLDDHGLDADSIRAVVSDRGATQIGPVDQSGRSALRDRLYTAGDLLRMNQLYPEQAALQFEPNTAANTTDE